MVDAMKSFLRWSIPNFENVYQRAKEYVRDNINPYCDILELSENSNCDICFPLTEDNLYILGLDLKSLTLWVFFDTNQIE